MRYANPAHSCLEGLFSTWGVFGCGFADDLERGGPKPAGARKASLSADVLPFAQEIALQHQVPIPARLVTAQPAMRRTSLDLQAKLAMRSKTTNSLSARPQSLQGWHA